MICRSIQSSVDKSLENFPVVGLVGPRQCGKTTLAKMIGNGRSPKPVLLDLELPADLFKLSEPEIFLETHKNTLVILDEIQRRPDLFPVLRALIDKKRRNGRFLILGSASPDLLKQSSESLAGRICYHELGPFALNEVISADLDASLHWLRGGYPLSLLSASNKTSIEWRNAFIQTYLERDIPQLGIRIPAVMLRRFWTMLAHVQGGMWNATQIAGSLGVTAPTARHYLDVLSDTYIIRQLTPYYANIGKRLVKSPKIYIRDSGLLHALMGITGQEALLGHPSAGASWEGWVIEQVLAAKPEDVEAFFYRTSSGAEIDLLLVGRSSPEPIALEIKRSSTPQLSRGFFEGYASLGCKKGFVIYPGKDSFKIKPGITAIPVNKIEDIVRNSLS